MRLGDNPPGLTAVKLSKCSAELMQRGQNGVVNAMFLCLLSPVFQEICYEPLQVFLWQVLMSLIARLARGRERGIASLYCTMRIIFYYVTVVFFLFYYSKYKFFF